MITPAQQCDGQPQHLPGLPVDTEFKTPLSCERKASSVLRSQIGCSGIACFLY